jgi:hypothetical protein
MIGSFSNDLHILLKISQVKITRCNCLKTQNIVICILGYPKKLLLYYFCSDNALYSKSNLSNQK